MKAARFREVDRHCAVQRRTGIRITDFGNALNNFDYTDEHRQHNRQPNHFGRGEKFSFHKMNPRQRGELCRKRVVVLKILKREAST